MLWLRRLFLRPQRMIAKQPPGGREPRLVALWKPHSTLSSFITDQDGARGRATLAHLNLPPGLINAGRLDRDSEGLLLLTDDGALCHRLLQGGVSKCYHVLVVGSANQATIDSMAAGGLLIRGRETRACQVRRLDWHTTNQALPQVSVHMKKYNSENSTWLEVILDQGMNRQIRRMTLHAGHKTVRLVRIGIGNLRLEALSLSPGKWCCTRQQDVF